MPNPDEVARLEDEISESPRGMWEACVDCPDEGLELFDAIIQVMPSIRKLALDFSDTADDLCATFDKLAKAKAIRDAEDAENCERQKACEAAESRQSQRERDCGK